MNKMNFDFKINTREKVLTSLTVFVIFSVVCYNFLISPLVENYSEAETELSAKKISLIKLKKLLAEEDAILEAYEKHVEPLKIRGVSEEEAVAQLLSKVESLTRKSGVFVSDVKPRPIKDFANYKKFQFEIELDGSIENITKFIYDLEASREAIRIEKLQINVKGAKQGLLKAELTITKLAIP